MGKTTKHGGGSHVPKTFSRDFGHIRGPWGPQPGTAAETAHVTSLTLSNVTVSEPQQGFAVYDASHEDEDSAATFDPTGPDQEDDVQIPAGNAATSEWRSFVRAQHGPAYPGDVEEASRDDLRDWYHETRGGGEAQEAVEPEDAAGQDPASDDDDVG